MRRGSRCGNGDCLICDCDGGRVVVESDFGNCPLTCGRLETDASSATARELALRKSTRPILTLTSILLRPVVVTVGNEGLGKCIERNNVLLQNIVSANEARRTIRRARSWRLDDVIDVVIALSSELNGEGPRRKRVVRAMLVFGRCVFFVAGRSVVGDGRTRKDGWRKLFF